MSRKKKAQEELMKTHVLNLNEIRDAEKKDIRERRRKIPKLFLIIGIVLIIVGVSISSLFAYLNTKKRNTVPYKKDKTKLTCISNLMSTYYKVDVHTETIYSFENDKLKESVSKVTSKPNGEVNYLEILKKDLNTNSTYMTDVYEDPKNGVSYKVNMVSKKELYLEFTIDYTYFKDATKQLVINNYSNVPINTNKDTYDNVKKQAEQYGALCN
jgi:hypothetical protein